jgi:hypothetical protein
VPAQLSSPPASPQPVKHVKKRKTQLTCINESDESNDDERDDDKETTRQQKHVADEYDKFEQAEIDEDPDAGAKVLDDDEHQSGGFAQAPWSDGEQDEHVSKAAQGDVKMESPADAREDPPISRGLKRGRPSAEDLFGRHNGVSCPLHIP